MLIRYRCPSLVARLAAEIAQWYLLVLPVICIMRRDSADGRQGWNGTYCATDYSAETMHCGRKGEVGSCPREIAESSFVIGTSSDRGLSWQLRLAPSFMLSARPRAVTLEHYGVVLVSGGRPPLAVWATRDGEHWTGFDIPANHNTLVQPAQRFCPEYSVGIRNVTFQQSSAYTSINKLSSTEALVCYMAGWLAGWPLAPLPAACQWLLAAG